MISSDLMRGYNDIIILAILNEGESYGYVISKTIQERSKERYLIKETTLYSAFARLEKNGYIESFDKTDLTYGSKRVYYRITSEGIKYLEIKKLEWKETYQVIDEFIGGK